MLVNDKMFLKTIHFPSRSRTFLVICTMALVEDQDKWKVNSITIN